MYLIKNKLLETISPVFVLNFHSLKTVCAQATSSQQVKDAADFGLQDKASTVAEAPSESEINRKYSSFC